MRSVQLDAIDLSGYRRLMPSLSHEQSEELRSRTRGMRVLHVNATPVGGGVAEILRSLVPLMNAAGMKAQWSVLDPHDEFFAVTKKLHNALQGKAVEFSQSEMRTYREHNEQIAGEIDDHARDADIVVLHDAQVLPAGPSLKCQGKLVWHCHVDLTEADDFARSELVAPLSARYHRCLVSMPEYAHAGLPADRTSVFAPAIDPFSAKNRALSADEARSIVGRLGIDLARPLATQVSRFDPWKDPFGVIDAYREARKSVPGLQLALVGALMAQDDPEGVEVLQAVMSHAKADPDIHVFSDPAIADDLTVNAIQTVSHVIIQKSVREGFGLTISEAMWKGRPVIGGNCGGIRLQIEDGVSGFLVNSPAECAERTVSLFADGELRRTMGSAARQRVRDRFLMPRLLLDYLGLFDELVTTEQRVPSTAVSQPTVAFHTSPVNTG